MNIINKNTDYAIRSLIEMSKDPSSFISSRKISEIQGIPLQFVRNILQVLVKEGIVESKEGATGGVRLSKSPEEIKLIDILKIFQGDIKVSECMFRKKICTRQSICELRKRLVVIEEKLINEFEGITIKNLVNYIAAN